MSCYEDKTESLHTLALNLAHLMNPNVKEMTAGEKKQGKERKICAIFCKNVQKVLDGWT